MINKCPKCDSDIENNAEICPKCNFDLTTLCPYCKQKIRIYDRVCPFCETDLFKVTDKILFYTGIGLNALWVLLNIGLLFIGYLVPILFTAKSSSGVYAFDLGTYFYITFGMLIPVIVPYLILIFKNSKDYKTDSYMWLISNILFGIIFMICFTAIRTKNVF